MPLDLENSIIEGDCLEVMKEIEDNSVDLIVTDPPYQLSSTSRSRTDMIDYDNGNGNPFCRQQARITGFMGKEWDVLPSVDVWKECLRVLKQGAFAFIMTTPRQDSLCQMIYNITSAGFNTGFTSIYWTYASGFPKASNIGKMVDKRNGRSQDIYQPFADYLRKQRKKKGLSMSKIDKMLNTNTAYSWWEGRLSGIQLPSKLYYLKLKKILDLDNRFDELIEREEAEREIIGKRKTGGAEAWNNGLINKEGGNEYTGQTEWDITKPATPEAKVLDGSYVGFQPKPAVEVILVAMKPLSEKTYVDQALKNGKGITWLDDCRVPSSNKLINGRFPANLLVSDDRLNDGEIRNSGKYKGEGSKSGGIWHKSTGKPAGMEYGDSGSFSRYFSLDKWFAKQLKKLPIGVQKTFPFLIVPKASKGEKNRGLEGFEEKNKDKGGSAGHGNHNPVCQTCGSSKFDRGNGICKCENPKWKAINKTHKNNHPTVKPLKLMSYLITLGSREGDLVLDPFVGSGTTCIACKQLNRRFIGIDNNSEYVEIAKARISKVQANLFAHCESEQCQ